MPWARETGKDLMVADPEIADLIREVLAEELARLRAEVREERVRIANDADLATFAKRVLAMADDRGARDAFEKGALVFRLDAEGDGAGIAVTGSGSRRTGPGDRRTDETRARGGSGAVGGASSHPPATGAQRTEDHTETIAHGLLSERQVERLPREVTRVRIGRQVRMTPLARDRLRRRGIAVERVD